MTEGLLYWWNSKFPHDRKYRLKYNIGFNSPQHRELNPIDIYMDIAEDHLFETLTEEIKTDRKNTELYKKGIWITQREEHSKELEDMFDNIPIDAFNEALNNSNNHE